MTTDSEAATVLSRMVDDIFWNDWDPIGIHEFPEARDEYAAYVIPMCHFLARKPSEAEIYHQLIDIGVNRIGLSSPNPTSSRNAARKLYLLTGG